MLTGILFAAVAVWGASAVFTAVCVRRAPEGFEDEAGFHFVHAPVPVKSTSEPMLVTDAERTFG